jgi:hypothetical protein
MEILEKRLADVASQDERWVYDAEWAAAADWDMNVIAEDEAVRLRRQVLEGQISLSELRAGVVWANALDREACELYGADFRSGAQVAERVARRHMHLAGRLALRDLKSSRLRIIHTVGIRRRPVVGATETHDIRDRNLVQ